MKYDIVIQIKISSVVFVKNEYVNLSLFHVIFRSYFIEFPLNKKEVSMLTY